MFYQRHILPFINAAGLCLILFLNSCGQDDNFELKRITFRVITPPDTGRVYITGNQDDLGTWDPGKIKLAKESDTSWINKFYFQPGEMVEYKFTRGDWQSEALDSLGRIPDNAVLKVSSDTIITVYIDSWANSKLNGRVFISSNLILNSKEVIIFGKDFKYHAGDNPDWKLTGYDDSEWPLVDPSMISDTFPSGWEGIGWFRIDLYVDSTLWGKPTAATVSHLGASEVYFNGQLLFSTGKIGKDSSEFQPEQRRVWESLIWEDTTHQTISVRYANYFWKDLLDKGFSPGFDLRLREINSTLSSTYNDTRTVSNYQILFTIVPLTLGFLHLFIFVFYPYDKQNLYYSLCLFAFAILSFSLNQRYFSTDVDNLVYYYGLVPISITFALLFGLYTTYTGEYKKLPMQHYLYLLLAVVITAIVILKPFDDLFIIIYSYMGLCIFEMVRVIVKSRERSQSSVFIIVGFMFLTAAVIYQILIDTGMVAPPGGYSLVYGYGVLALIFCMSMALSFNFAKINKNLKEQLGNVEVLSRINLERERAAKKTEIERTLLEADNKRKTDELEEARKLQLSFLPKIIPQVKGYDIAVFMKTATEVGGDYYDFHISRGELTAVIGDATGHGARAGTMVSAVKGLFNVLADEPEPLSMIRKYTNALKSMNLHNLYMSFAIAKLKDSSLLYSNAGMPPLLIYRCRKGLVEEIVQKTMPLGSFLDFPYTQEKIDMETGDTILFLSDGFTEAFNPEGDILGLQRAKEIFLSCAERTVEEIVECIRLEIELWQAGDPPKDDMTFVVVKKTNH